MPQKKFQVTFNQLYKLNGPFIMTSIGRPESGKTSFHTYCMYNMGHIFNEVYAICGSPSAGTDYYFIKKGNLSRTFNKKFIVSILAYAEDNPDKQFALFLDDLVGTVDMLDDVIKALVSKFRHYNMTLFFGLQSVRQGVPTLLKDATTYAVMFTQSTGISMNAVHEAFGEEIPKNIFFPLMRKMPKFCFLFYDNYNKMEPVQAHEPDPSIEEESQIFEQFYADKKLHDKHVRSGKIVPGFLPERYTIARIPGKDIPKFKLVSYNNSISEAYKGE
jgi:hypothetical protein